MSSMIVMGRSSTYLLVLGGRKYKVCVRGVLFRGLPGPPK